MKNKYLATIYKSVVDGDSLRKIHKKLYDETIKNKVYDKVLLASMIKVANKAKKIHARENESLALLIYMLYKNAKVNDVAKKIINYDTMRDSEAEKKVKIDSFIDKSREHNEWFYLASSHNDCAEDHKPYQGKLYVDEKAPKDVIDYAKSRGMYTIQWVMGEPAWFITRPNCRHYFVSMGLKEVSIYGIGKLKKIHKTHTVEGNRYYSTPAHEAVKEYEDRLKLLRALYREHPIEILKKDMLKTELLVKKWKRAI